MLLTPIGFNSGGSNDFHLQPGSPAIDAGDPTSPFVQEPSPNGGQINQGYDGDTPQAQVSPSAATVQVLSPGGLAKYQAGEQLPINFETTGLTTEQPVLLLNAGGPSIATGLQGNWSGDAFRTDGQTIANSVSAATIGTIANVPTALFSSAAELANGAATGQALTFQLPVQNGTYTMTLYFADPSANAAGQRLFNIIANGQTLQANYDIFAAAKAQYAGDGNHAVSLTFTVTVTGGQGLALDLVALATTFGPLVSGIALEQADPNGTASPAATVQVSTDGGMTWSTIATNVPVNAYGQGQYLWTVNQTSNGNTALIRVLGTADASSSPITISGTSQPFLLSNGGNNYYINDNSLAGDLYTTAVGNDANSGKSPDQPLGSLAALLRAYPIGPGDTIYVDAGNYTLKTNITLSAADSGSASQPLVIAGPSIGSAAVFNRNNTTSGTDVFDLNGVSNHRDREPDARGRVRRRGSRQTAPALTLQNDVIAHNLNDGVDVPYNVGVTNLTVKNSTIDNDGSLVYGYGIYFGYNNSGILLQNDQVYNILGIGLYLNGAGNQTVQGGSYYDNVGNGVSNNSTALIEDVVAYGNYNPNGSYGISSTGGTTTGNTVFGNANVGISATGLISDNVVYSQRNSSVRGDRCRQQCDGHWQHGLRQRLWSVPQ